MSEHPDPEQPNRGSVAEAHGHGDPELLFRKSDSVGLAFKESLGRFRPIALHGRWLINSHPKSGTHLVRNILGHFNWHAFYRPILFFDTFEPVLRGATSQFYAGHIPYAMFAVFDQIEDFNSVLLIRHPYAIALALARAFYDINTTRADHLQMREEFSFSEIVKRVICGYDCAGIRSSPLAKSLSEFTCEWLGQTPFTVKFEEIVARLKGPDYRLVAYLAPLLEGMYGAVPDDAAQRIRAGAAPAISVTFSRTRDAAAVRARPADVPSLVPATEARRLREIAVMLGYGKATFAT